MSIDKQELDEGQYKHSSSSKMRLEIEEFQQWLRLADKKLHHSTVGLRVLRIAGRDFKGRRVLVVNCSLFQPFSEEYFEALLLRAVRLCNFVLHGENYSVVLLATFLQQTHRPSILQVTSALRQLPKLMMRRMKMIYVLHPHWSFRLKTWFASLFAPWKLWKKLTYCYYLETLFTYIRKEEIAIPRQIVHHDMCIVLEDELRNTAKKRDDFMSPSAEAAIDKESSVGELMKALAALSTAAEDKEKCERERRVKSAEEKEGNNRGGFVLMPAFLLRGAPWLGRVGELTKLATEAAKSSEPDAPSPFLKRDCTSLSKNALVKMKFESLEMEAYEGIRMYEDLCDFKP